MRIQFLFASVLLIMAGCRRPVAVMTQHNDNSRTGANLSEVTLDVAAVKGNRFGKLFRRPVVGAVYAQPLVVPNVAMRDKGAHSKSRLFHQTRMVVYIATMHNYVYAFDAENANETSPLWAPVSLGPSVHLPDGQVGPDGYQDIEYEVGIVSTPVISATRNAIYLVAFSKDRGQFTHRLHMLNLLTGQPITNSVVISGTVPCGNNQEIFDSKRQNQRAALLLASDTVYVAFASYGDRDVYHGWVFGYDAGTLASKGIYNSSPCGNRAGIWMAGQGPAADAAGNLYVMTGNGSFDPNGSKLGTSIIKLTPGLQLASWFSPYNNQALDGSDQDLGSAGALLLPGTELAVGGGKESKLYVVNATNMGGFRSTDDNQIVQWFSVAGPGSDTHHIHGSPVYWEGPKGKHIYVWTENDFLKAYKFDGLFQTSPDMVSTTKDPENLAGGSRGMPGGILSISANGSGSGTGVLWASHPYRGNANQEIVPGVLRAYDANNLTSELWNSEKNPARDPVGNFAKFNPPTVANGRVYMASMGGLQNKTILLETARGGPALADLNSQSLVIAWTGTDTDGHLNVAKSTDARNFNKITLGETSNLGPALCFGSGRLFLAWTGTDSRLNVRSSADGVNWPDANKVTLGETSDHGPALACGNNTVYLAWTGTDGRLNVRSSSNGLQWPDPNKRTLSETSNTGPALAFIQSLLYMEWTGTDGRLNLLESPNGTQFSNKRTLGETSGFHSALAYRGGFFLSWTGTDSNSSLNLRFAENDSTGPDYKATYDDSSRAGPALAVYGGSVYIGWTGTDSDAHLNVAELSLGSLEVYGLRN